MGKLIAVEGCELTLSNGSAISVTITSPASKLKATNKGVYFGDINISISGFSSEKVDSGSGKGIIRPTAKSVSRKKNKVIRVDDVSDQITIYGTKSGEPATDIVTVKITDAGQNRDKAE